MERFFLFRWIDRFLDRAAAVIGAFLFSQLPVFFQQYFQRLAGHLQELNVQIGLMQKAAEASGKNLTQWITKSLASGDPDFIKQGEIFQGMVTRQEQFQSGMNAWWNSSIWEHPFVFLRHLNWDVARGTFDHYQFGVAFSIEGLIYALVGLILGFSVYFGITRFIGGIWRILFPKKEPLEPLP